MINANLQTLYNASKSRKNSVLEGGSRSGKTWSCIDFIIWYCANNYSKNINIIRKHFSTFSTTIFADMNARLPQFGIQSPLTGKSEIRMLYLFGNRIRFLGADDPAKIHGAGSDLLWFNEAIDIDKDVFDQAEQRCRGLWIMDYNPKFTVHWVYDLERRDDVVMRRTTWRDNPFISENEKRKILSYEPTPENIERGTADEYLWKVYGLGERAAPTGLVFKHINWIDRFPDDCEKIFFGLDFGYTNSPSALVKCGISGENLFYELLFYAPTESSKVLAPLLEQTKGFTVWADPSGRGMITELRHMGYRVFAANTFPGSIKFGISLMKKYRIHIVNNIDARREAENYCYREINGYLLDEPIDDYNHFWDAARIAVMSNLPRTNI